MAGLACFKMFRKIVPTILQPALTVLARDVAVAVNRSQVSAEVISVVLSFEHCATYGAS